MFSWAYSEHRLCDNDSDISIDNICPDYYIGLYNIDSDRLMGCIGHLLDILCEI